ncbi:MAG: GIY-YIG nuclease family protein [Ectothiorhodospiraceae bacterium AqS1]|nr:GIY-YIG nuclease family protein [Ectothiorhodospiraceae bacterium AqS1]
MSCARNRHGPNPNSPRCIIKIGISAKPRARIAAINGGPISFKFVAAISGSKRNVRSLESGLHGRIASEGLNSNREYHWEERSTCTDRMIAESAERLASIPIFDIEYLEDRFGAGQGRGRSPCDDRVSTYVAGGSHDDRVCSTPSARSEAETTFMDAR